MSWVDTFRGFVPAKFDEKSSWSFDMLEIFRSSGKQRLFQQLNLSIAVQQSLIKPRDCSIIRLNEETGAFEEVRMLLEEENDEA